jgi:amphi-Trp domain-containing protein
MTDDSTPEAERVSDDEKTTIRAGRDFEQTYRLDARSAGEFLVALGEQLQSGGELTITAEEWELPFSVGEPVELEVDYEGVEVPTLEIELELPSTPDEEPPAVE